MKMKKLLTLGLLSVCAFCSAQTTQVPFNGVVSDMFGKPLKGARIYVVNSNYYTRSDKKGRFGLTNVLADDTLHVVYEKNEYKIPVQARKSICIRLGDQMIKEADEDMELVDLGYGYVKRREQTTSSSGISGEVLCRTGKTNVLEALKGLVPGMIVSGGGFGREVKANIRGMSTLYGSTDPLYVVDGVTVSSLDFINLYDVESVEVMKDGSIYGVRGANGAIVVHTKKR